MKNNTPKRPDKINGKVWYYDDEHVYVDKDSRAKYTSVTTIIHNYTQEFDSGFWSAYKALEALMESEDFAILKKSLLANKKFNPIILKKFDINEEDFYNTRNDILNKYDEERNKSCERGTKIHAEFEQQYYKEGKQKLNNFGLSGDFVCRPHNYELDLHKGIYPEYLIAKESADGILKVAGQIDLLVKDGNDIYIYDYKGLPLDTPILTKEGWKDLRYITKKDRVFDKNGHSTAIVNVSENHYNPCFQITFDNGETITADHEHRWLITLNSKSKKPEEKIMTTEELYAYLPSIEWRDKYIPRIAYTKPIQFSYKRLPKDPYMMGQEMVSKAFITNIDITPYLTSSYHQRLEFLRGIMDKRGLRKRQSSICNITLRESPFCDNFLKLLSTFGWKYNTKVKYRRYVEKYIEIRFTSSENPFKNKYSDYHFTPVLNFYRTIKKVERVDTVVTKCLEVASPTHTFLAGPSLIVTHNTNKEIKQKGYYNRSKRSYECMKFPLNKIIDTNYWHYTLQLSLYAYLLQQINPNFNIKLLKLIHVDHDNVTTEYEVDYLKEDVERMLKHFKRQIKIQDELDKIKPIYHV